MAEKPSEKPSRMIIEALPEGGYVLKRYYGRNYDDEELFASEDLTAVFRKLTLLIYMAPGSVS